MLALVDQFCASYARAPASIILDIDDTFDAVHGRQQLSLFNAHYDERCFLPIHIYEGTSGKPVAVILRSGKTPGGIEVRTILKHVIARIRRHWPKVDILVRGDSHYGRSQGDGLVRSQWDWLHLRLRRQPESLAGMIRSVADAVCVERAVTGTEKLRRWSDAALRRQELAKTAPCRRPDRGDEARPRCPLRRHLAQGQRQASL